MVSQEFAKGMAALFFVMGFVAGVLLGSVIF